MNGGVIGGVNGGVNDVFEYISENPGKKAAELSDALGISLRTVERYLSILRDEGRIIFTVAPKTGGYF